MSYKKSSSQRPKNGDIKIAGSAQIAVEEKILKALKGGEKTKTDLYKVIGGYKVNGSELQRILEELFERSLLARYRHGPQWHCWRYIAYDSTIAIRHRQQEAEEAVRRRIAHKAWLKEQHRKKVDQQWHKFLLENRETIMLLFKDSLRALRRYGVTRSRLHQLLMNASGRVIDRQLRRPIITKRHRQGRKAATFVNRLIV